MFSFYSFSPHVLRDPSTDRPETLLHDRNLAEFYNPTRTNRGGAHPNKFGCQKHAKFRSIFRPLHTLIANISGTPEDIQNRPALQTMTVMYTLMYFFSGDYSSALRECCSVKFLHALEINLGYLAHTPTGMRVPQKI